MGRQQEGEGRGAPGRGCSTPRIYSEARSLRLQSLGDTIINNQRATAAGAEMKGFPGQPVMLLELSLCHLR